MRRLRSGLAALVAASCAGVCAPAAPTPPPQPGPEAEPPRLVLMLVVDQLRPEGLDPELPGGLGRLAREGRLFADGVHDHAHTETCPGHAVLLSGVHPGRAGVPGNQFVDRESGRAVYCVEDPDSPVLGGGPGRSPRLLRAPMLGDWLREAHPAARVHAVSGKDRAAVAMGGQRAHAAWWIDRRGGGFTTSRWYRDALPAWVAAFNARLGEGLPERWEHPTGAPANGARRDDFPAESGLHGRESGHPLRGDDAAGTVARLLYTPWADTVTLAFARELIEREGLGRDAHPDLLALSLSATDMIGHLYGPESQEARDALRRLDADLAEFLGFLEERIGGGHLLIALSSDHGVLPIPEWLVETGRSECPVEGGRADARALLAWLEGELRRELDPPDAEPGRWLETAGHRITVSRERARELHVPVERVVALAEERLERVPGVVEAWTADEILGAPPEDRFAALYRSSYDRERGGDLDVQTAPTCLFTAYGRHGTSHGTPYLYDRAVPILFHGPGVEPGVVRGRAATVDIGPTLARALGIPTPEDLDGRALALRPEPGADPGSE